MLCINKITDSIKTVFCSRLINSTKVNYLDKICSNLGYRSNFRILFVVLAAFVGSSILFTSTRFGGFGVTSDSVIYISGANNLINGKGFISFDGTPIVDWMPGYSLALILSNSLFGDIIESARWLNILLFVLIIFLSSRFMNLAINADWLFVTGVLSITLSIPLLTISVNAWSEPLFIVLCLAFLWMMFKIQEKDTNPSLWIAACLLLCLVFTRYIGIVLMPLIIIILIMRQQFLRKSFQQIILIVAIVGFPLLLWFGRNYSMSATIAGDRQKLAAPFIENFYKLLDTLSGWLFPEMIPLSLRILFTILIVLTFLWTRTKYNSKFIFPHLSFVLLYIAFILLVTSMTELEKPGLRYMSPIYVSVMVLLFGGLDKIYNKSQNSRKTVVFLSICWISFLIVQLFAQVGNWMDNSIDGYLSKRWKQSETLHWVLQNQTEGLILSNFPDALYVINGVEAKQSPLNNQVEREKFLHLAKLESPIYLIWFIPSTRKYLLDVEDLMKIPALDWQVIFSANDGMVLRLN